jgi:hypothetical protein
LKPLPEKPPPDRAVFPSYNHNLMIILLISELSNINSNLPQQASLYTDPRDFVAQLEQVSQIVPLL